MARAGEFRDRIVLKKPVYTADTVGGAVTTWETVHTVWGKYEPSVRKGRNETYEAGRLETRVVGRLWIRYSSTYLDIGPEWQAVIGSIILNINSIIQSDRRKRLFELEVTYGTIAV